MRDPLVSVPTGILASQFRAPDIEDFTSHMCGFGRRFEMSEYTVVVARDAVDKISSIEGAVSSLGRALQPVEPFTSPVGSLCLST